MDYIITRVQFQLCITNGFRAAGGRNWLEIVRVNSVQRCTVILSKKKKIEKAKLSHLVCTILVRELTVIYDLPISAKPDLNNEININMNCSQYSREQINIFVNSYEYYRSNLKNNYLVILITG